MLPIGRLSRDSAVFRKEGDAGVLVRKLVMGELPHLHSYRFDGIPERGVGGGEVGGDVCSQFHQRLYSYTKICFNYVINYMIEGV